MSFFVPASGEHVSIRSIYNSLGELKSLALPGFHAISGCDTTGCLNGKGKLSYWKVFEAASDEQLVAFAELGKNPEITSDIVDQIEQYTCKIYQFNTKSSSLAELRWSMFTTKQAIGERLPPTRDSLIPAVKRANFQSLIWAQDEKPKPVIPSPQGYGWSIEDGQLVPVKCEISCAPESLLELVKCSCVKSKCRPPCRCLSNNIPCTEMCACKSDEDNCDNVFSNSGNSSNTDSSDSEQ